MASEGAYSYWLLPALISSLLLFFREGAKKGKRESVMGVRNGEHNLISVPGKDCIIFNIAGYDFVNVL
jgi:hypothetical protein